MSIQISHKVQKLITSSGIPDNLLRLAITYKCIDTPTHSPENSMIVEDHSWKVISNFTRDLVDQGIF